MTISEAQREQRRKAGKRGGAVRAKQFTPEHQRAAGKRGGLARSKQFTPESQRAAAMALLDKYGPGYTAERGADYRRKLENMSGPMKTVYYWLLDWGYRFDVEAPMGPYFADFWLHKIGVVIEVNGDYWHNGRQDYDIERTRYIAAARRQVVIWLSEKAVVDGSAKRYLEDRLTVFADLHSPKGTHS